MAVFHFQLKLSFRLSTVTYDHTHWRIRDPVCSPIDKPVRGGLVVGSVTTSEYPLLYVFAHHTYVLF
ncbi:hypothetical protein FOXYSP1_14500 [Fusarium oxysporum f. sp. phaseoli]